MRNRITTGAFYGMPVMLLAQAAVGFNAWELVHEAQDLRVERRDYQGSELDGIKGVVRIEALLNAVMALWMPLFPYSINCQYSKESRKIFASPHSLKCQNFLY